MGKYILKRMLLVILIILCVAIIVFSIINFIPGDPGRRILGIGATQEQVDLLNAELGYNLSFPHRLLNYLRDILFHGDFGTSYQDSRLVLDVIAVNFPYTLKLAIMQTLCYSFIGITLGILSAVKQYSAVDNIVRVVSIALSAFPGFWVYMLAILFFSLRLGWLPSNGADTWRCYVLPIACSSILSASGLQRMVRTTMLETIRQDYVRTARAKGCSEMRVIWRHAFMNAILPVINQVGVSFGMMLGGTVIIETVFSMPGLGSVIVKAIQAKDVPLVMGCTIFLSAIFCVLIVLLDVFSALVDPRVKAKLIK